jgi:hypothetical protein
MKFPTLVLIAGAAVLLIAVVIGQRMGDRVMQQATEQQLQSGALPTFTPAGGSTPAAYGPNWKRSQSLSAASDPRFPDPRVPPAPLPSALPAPPKAKLTTPQPTPTINPNIPIWRQKPLPTARPTAEPPAGGVPASPSDDMSPGASPAPPNGDIPHRLLWERLIE